MERIEKFTNQTVLIDRQITPNKGETIVVDLIGTKYSESIFCI